MTEPEIIGLIIGALGLFVGIPSVAGYFVFFKFLKQKWKNNKSRSIILRNRKDWIIITPRYEHNFQRQEDILAANLIHDWCQKIGANCLIHDDCVPIPPDKDLIFICGPKANKQVSQYYRGLNLDLCIDNDGDKHEYIILDKSCGQKYYSKISEAEKMDYAILSRTFDKNSGRYSIFCMGIKGLGTLGAANILTTGLTENMSKKVRKSEMFESIVSVPYVDNNFSMANVNFTIPPRI